jgi:nucleoid-associated protein EbfC
MSKHKPIRGGGAPAPRVSPQGKDMLAAFQQKMEETQASLANETLEVSVGGGAVKVVVNGQQKIQSVTISPDAVNASDVEMLQDLIVAAVNEAVEKSQQLASSKVSSITGGMGLGGLLG